MNELEKWRRLALFATGLAIIFFGLWLAEPKPKETTIRFVLDLSELKTRGTNE